MKKSIIALLLMVSAASTASANIYTDFSAEQDDAIKNAVHVAKLLVAVKHMCEITTTAKELYSSVDQCRFFTDKILKTSTMQDQLEIINLYEAKIGKIIL